MRRHITVACLAAVFATGALAAPVLEPTLFREDFTAGSVGAWSAYPPSQDTAYDPTITVLPLAVVPALDRALYREVTPVDSTGCLLGVRRIVQLYVDRASTLSFRCTIEGPGDAVGIRVRFGFADGSDIVRTLPAPARSAWREMTVSLADIVPGEGPVRLDALAIMADLRVTDPEAVLRFGIDDVRVTGFRESPWRITSPAVHCLAEWREAIAARHFIEGDVLTLTVQPPIETASAEVILSHALTGEEGPRIALQRGNGVWTARIPLDAASGVGPGMWRARLRCADAADPERTSGDEIVFLVFRRDAPASNPRLLASGADLPAIRERASAGWGAEIKDAISASAARYRGRYEPDVYKYNLDAFDEEFWLPTYGGYITAIRTPSQAARANAVAAALTGDAAAADAARRILLELAKWPSFVHPHILAQGQFTYWPVGQMIGDLAIAYDFIAPRLTGPDRASIARMLFEKGMVPVFDEYVRDNRVSSDTSNWIGDVTGGGILCALAVRDDFTDDQLEPYLTGLLLKMGAFLNAGFDRDGAYGEDYAYLDHALKCLNPALAALDRSLGLDVPASLSHSHEFLCYQLDDGTGELIAFGDSRNTLARMSTFAHLLARWRDPHLAWLYNRNPGLEDVDLFLLPADPVAPLPPDDLPAVRLFRDTGTAVFRSGFGTSDFTLIFRCGPFFNHQHFDQGGIRLRDGGETFIGEAGPSDYYTDPWYQRLVIQPGGHSTILADGRPAARRAGDFLQDVPAWDTRAAITDFIAFEGGGFVSGDIAPLSDGDFTVCRRSILYLAPRTAILVDEVAGSAAVKTVEARFHAPLEGDIAIHTAFASITRPKGALAIRTIHPAADSGYATAVRKRPLTLHEFAGEDPVTMRPRGYLAYTVPLPKGGTVLVNVLTTDAALADTLAPDSGEGFVSVVLQGMRYRVNITPPAGDRTWTDGTLASDALLYAENSDGWLAMRATRITLDGDTVLAADRPVSIRCREGDVALFEYASAEPVRLTLGFAVPPRVVTLDGNRVRGWKYDDDRHEFTLDLPAGRGVLGLK